MQNVITRKELVDNVAELGDTSPDSRLKVSLTGRNPDDGISMIPYVKGYAFLRVIENAVGREKFDVFIKNYFDAHAFKSITTEDFVKYINENLIKGDKTLADKIKLEDWIYKPGIPSNITPVNSVDFDAIDKIQNSWRETGVKGLSQKITTTSEKQYFIDHLPTDITPKEMEALDTEFNFTKGGNFIIKRQWFIPSIRYKYTAAYPAIEQFLISTSRTGSVMMLYKEMAKTPEGKVWANKIFDKAKSGYHATTVQAVGDLLK
jgi:leukotriene-A4 hydrolase